MIDPALWKQVPAGMRGYPGAAAPAPTIANSEGRSGFGLVAPLGSGGFAGSCDKTPDSYRVTVALPHINTLEALRVCVDLLRLQTERPFIMVIDTGSPPDVCAELVAMRAEDLEVHFIAAHGYRHSSEPVAVALDLAHALCRTDLLLHTHTDCFLRRRDAVETLARLATVDCPAVGYRMSPRDWITTEWEWMVGHTLLMLYMPMLHGATWSFSRMRDVAGFSLANRGGWPDTETGFNHALRAANISPAFIGFDRNYERQVDDWIDHCRSYPGSKLMHPDYYEKARQWMRDALTDARARIAEWSKKL